MCILLGLPQLGHLTNVVTSFKAFPAICRCLFLLYDVFFFGTARNRPSHSSCSIDDMPAKPNNGIVSAEAAAGGSRILCKTGSLRMDCGVWEGIGWNIGRRVCSGSDLAAIATEAELRGTD